MPKAVKYNWFGGVFTPSVLTILGVVMYLKLGQVVGEAGILMALLVIVISHVISVTTGLSVSSIATDKKVKAGGLYYILSRSLGLPIGGAIGITLVIGTALSISLYLFALSGSVVEALEPTAVGAYLEQFGDYKVQFTASIILATLTTIALISTSLVIKTQYYIMAGIFLSLISIVVGVLVTDHGVAATQVNWLRPPKYSMSFSELFGIFFPAVTGFTAGVAMSGDLRDPKRAIPSGTIRAIIVGFVVYTGLAIFFGIYLNYEQLQKDENILSKVAYFANYGAPLLLTGFWGAALSSALGGILGGPRIMQAIAMDNIKLVPKVFAKGVGASNEPRNALFFTVVVAELGFWIGDLNQILEVVSMFYLTAYGFINLTCLLEGWTGSEFRPLFKIPNWVSLLGTIATFVVMAQLNAPAMLAAFVVIGAIFIYLKRTQVSLGFGDIWQGVWSEVVRLALYRMNKQNSEDRRNWRPNIILFSGKSSQRPHLVDFGKWVTGRLGVLSNFDLIENKDSDILFTKAQQVVTQDDGSLGVFTRRYQCSDIYLGIESIAETYGFSGIEPNTVLMGWARRSAQRNAFVKAVEKLHRLDYNLLLMDYDERVGFGQESSIDIWWRGDSSDVLFALTTARFLTSSTTWKQAKVRLCIVLRAEHINPIQLRQKLEEILEDQRVQAEILIVTDFEEKRKFETIVREESLDTDLILLGLPYLDTENQEEFFLTTNQLCKEIGTVVLYRAASQFADLPLSIDLRPLEQPKEEEVKEIPPQEKKPEKQPTTPENVPKAWTPPEESDLEAQVRYLNDSMKEWIQLFYRDYLHGIEVEYQKLLEEIKKSWQRHNSPKPSMFVWLRSMGMTEPSEERMMSEVLEALRNYHLRHEEFERELLKNGHEMLAQKADRFINEVPNLLSHTYYPEALEAKPNYPEVLNHFTTSERVVSWFSGGKRTRHFRYSNLLTYFLKQHFEAKVVSVKQQYLLDTWRFQEELNTLFKQASGEEQPDEEQIRAVFAKLMTQNADRFREVTSRLETEKLEVVDQISSDLSTLEVRPKLKRAYRVRRRDKKRLEESQDTAEAWLDELSTIVKTSELSVVLQIFGWHFRQIVKEFRRELREQLDQQSLQPIKALSKELNHFQTEHPDQDRLNALALESGQPEYPQQLIDDFLLNFKGITHTLPTNFQLLNTESIRHLLEKDFDDKPETINLSLPNVLNYVVQTNFTEPVLQQITTLHEIKQKAYGVSLDVVRIISFSLADRSSETGDEEEEMQTNVQNLIEDERKRLREQQRELEKELDVALEYIERFTRKTLDQLSPLQLTQVAENLDQYLRSQNRIQTLNRFSKLSRQLTYQVQSQLTERYFERLEWLKGQKAQPHLSPTQQLVKFTFSLKPKPEILEQLPFYYEQLFLRQHTTSRELWRG
ncbi:MAG: hypothetical protein AAF740_00970, partial [Bacteroidota bacterium]